MTRNKNTSLRIIIILIFATLFQNQVFSAADTTANKRDLGYRQYMKIVLSRNLELQAEKYNVDISQAEIVKSSVRPDPVIDIERSSSRENNAGSMYSLTAEISRTFELGGARRARINLALSGNRLAEAALDEFSRQLVSDATVDYLTAMKDEYLYRVILNSWQMMKDLADADSVRLSLGSIKYIDAAQSRIESGVLLNEVLNHDAERKASAINLSSRMGMPASDTIFNLTGKFENYFRKYNIDTLLNAAMSHRADLRVARDNISWYRSFLELTKSERATDIDLRIGAGQDYATRSVRDPEAHSIYAGVSVPLKFSNLNKGEVKIARYQVAQSELQFKQVELQVRNEVIQAYTRYATLCRQVENYEKGLLEKSGEVLKGKVYSYSRGETSLLEVLNAQRTYNDLQTSYLDTVYSCFVALTELEKAAGTCNIDL